MGSMLLVGVPSHFVFFYITLLRIFNRSHFTETFLAEPPDSAIFMGDTINFPSHIALNLHIQKQMLLITLSRQTPQVKLKPSR